MDTATSCATVRVVGMRASFVLSRNVIAIATSFGFWLFTPDGQSRSILRNQAVCAALAGAIALA